MNKTIDEEKTVQVQVIGTSGGSTEKPFIPAPLPDVEEFAREICELIRGERSRGSAENVDPDRIIFTTQDKVLARVFSEIQSLVIYQCGPEKGYGVCLGELFALLICLDDPAQAAAFIRDLLAAGLTWMFIRKHMGIRRETRLSDLCAAAEQSPAEYAREHYKKLLRKTSLDGITVSRELVDGITVSRELVEEITKIGIQTASCCDAFEEFGELVESVAEAYEEFREFAGSAIPEPDGNERIKQIERVRRHRSRKGMKRRK